MEQVRTDVPSLYVGELRRSLYERSREHWKQWESRDKRSHIQKHMELAHKEDEKPDFVMRAVSYHKSALTRQVGEAVRIGRRGGAGQILNSKSEYDRCRIPRLVVAEIEEEEILKKEEQELEITRANIEEQAMVWSNRKYEERREEDLRKWRIGEYSGSTINKREPEILEGAKKKKRRKYKIIKQDWGLGEQHMAAQMEPVVTAGSYSTEEHKEPQTAAVLEELRATVGARRQSKLSDLWPAPVLETAPPPMDAAPAQERAMGATPRTGLPLDVEGTVRVELYDIDERFLRRGCDNF